MIFLSIVRTILPRSCKKYRKTIWWNDDRANLMYNARSILTITIILVKVIRKQRFESFCNVYFYFFVSIFMNWSETTLVLVTIVQILRIKERCRSFLKNSSYLLCFESFYYLTWIEINQIFRSNFINSLCTLHGIWKIYNCWTETFLFVALKSCRLQKDFIFNYIKFNNFLSKLFSRFKN